MTIVCSDIDTKVLATAERGVYAADARGLTPERLRRHFLRGTGANDGSIRARPELARLLEFRQLNLMHERWSLGRALRRRVLPQRDDLLRRADTAPRARAHAPRDAARAALLFVGHSENFSASNDLFRLRGKTVYERVGGHPPGPTAK